MTLPHSKVAGSEFSRVNGDVRLSLVAPSEPGLPYGMYPRLILMHLADKWVTWPGRGVQVTLGERFYTIARSGSVPLDAGILDGLGRSPLALDAYAWLTYRVARLERETVIPWRSLEIQFGAEYKHPRQFRWKFCRSLEAIKGLWNGIETEPREKGLLLRPCAPSVLSWLEQSNARDAFLR